MIEPGAIFIVGVGRSGTSLLQSMLHAHPQIRFLPETGFFRRYVADRRPRRWSPERLQETLATDQQFQRAGIEPQDAAREGAWGLYLQMRKSAAGASPPRYVGDKDPRSIECLPEVKRRFPDAIVIHVMRDPRDVLLSRMKAKWSAGRPWWVHPLIYRSQFRRGRIDGARLFGEQWIELKYETLIAQPRSTLERLCEQLSLAYHPDMLAFSQAAQELVARDELSWKKETLGQLLADNAGKWRRELTSFQALFVEAACKEAFVDVGYERLSNTEKLRWRDRLLLGASPAIRSASLVAYQAARMCFS
ncbi:MAG: hypothetical protein CMJ58_19430 [Planctomycetaceae bacterium]|nr:hypothetical protein [Planctomycetaceae bacterium]